MLALSRKEGESLLVGEFQVTVLEVMRNSARLRIAPLESQFSVEFWAHLGQEFRIGEDISGQVAASSSNRVRIALKARDTVLIMRSELKGRTASRPPFPGMH